MASATARSSSSLSPVPATRRLPVSPRTAPAGPMVSTMKRCVAELAAGRLDTVPPANGLPALEYAAALARAMLYKERKIVVTDDGIRLAGEANAKEERPCSHYRRVSKSR